MEKLKKATKELYDTFAYINLCNSLSTFNLDRYDLDKIKQLVNIVETEVLKGREKEKNKKKGKNCWHLFLIDI